jgi:hypothetical protein
MIKIIFFLILIQFDLSNAYADHELIKIFKESYTTNYIEGRCGDNIKGLVNRANAKRINLNQANILIIENKGFTLMGMLNVEYARGSRRDGKPGPTNWFHHVILEKEGLIYDYDYGSAPQVASVKTYFEKMFLSDKRGEGSNIDYVNPEDKLNEYEVEIIHSADMLNAQRDRMATPDGKKMSLRQYLGL